MLLAVAGELLGPVGGGLLLPHLHPPACCLLPSSSTFRGFIMQTVDTRECPLSSVAINWCQVRDGF